MIRKYHNNTPKANTQRREEEPQNTHSNNTSVGQPKKASSYLFFVKMIAKLEKTQGILNKDKHRTPTNNGKYIKQYINNNKTLP